MVTEASSENILECENIEKSFFAVRVLRNVSIALQKGRIVGLVGENGAGKSTLMNILGGVVRADSGTMRLGGNHYAPHNPAEAFRHGIGFIHQELNLFTNLSVAENLFIAAFPKRRILWVPFIHRQQMRKRAEALLGSVELGVSPKTLVEDLSPGERQLVEIAKALGGEARILILDEPTTSLTARETERLFNIIERLRKQGISMIYISHILGDVLRLCDEIVVLRDGEVVGKGRKDEFTLERIISLMVGRSIDLLYPRRSVSPSEERVLEVSRLSQRGIIENISFSVQKGEVLGVAGLMGSGRTELARVLFGLDPVERGEILLNGVPLGGLSPVERIQRGMAFLTENRREEGILMNASIADNVSLVSLRSFGKAVVGFIDRARMQSAVRGVADSVRLPGTALERREAKTLSGGNQQKVVFAKWLVERPLVFILDEPTRGIDVGAKYEVYKIINALAAQGTGVLFISSQIEELVGMCDKILVMRRGEIRECVEREAFHKERILRAALGEKVVQ